MNTRKESHSKISQLTYWLFLLSSFTIVTPIIVSLLIMLATKLYPPIGLPAIYLYFSVMPLAAIGIVVAAANIICLPLYLFVYKFPGRIMAVYVVLVLTSFVYLTYIMQSGIGGMIARMLGI